MNVIALTSRQLSYTLAIRSPFFKIRNSIYQYFYAIQIIYKQLFSFKCLIIILGEWLNSSNLPISGAIIDIINPGQNRQGSKSYEMILHIFQIYGNRASP